MGIRDQLVEVSSACLLCEFQESKVARCLSQGFYSWTNTMTKKQVGRKEFIELTLPYSCSSPKEVRTGTQAGQEAGADAEATEGCYLLVCSAWSLIEPKNTSPETVPTTRGPPRLISWSLIEKMPHSWISWRHFPNWSSFPCDNSSLCQVDTKPASTIDPWSTWHTNISLFSLNPYFLIHPQDLNNFKCPTQSLHIKSSILLKYTISFKNSKSLNCGLH